MMYLYRSKNLKLTCVALLTTILLLGCTKSPKDKFLDLVEDGKKINIECASGILENMPEEQHEKLYQWAVELKEKRANGVEPKGFKIFKGLDKEAARAMMSMAKSCRVET